MPGARRGHGNTPVTDTARAHSCKHSFQTELPPRNRNWNLTSHSRHTLHSPDDATKRTDTRITTRVERDITIEQSHNADAVLLVSLLKRIFFPQVMDKNQKRSKRRPKRPTASAEEPQEEARVDERGNVLRLQRSTSSEVAESLDEAGAPVFVERVCTQVQSSDSPAGGESPRVESRIPASSEVEYVDEDFELPEPKTETQTEEYEDGEGRRVVVTTTITTTYEQTDDEDGNTVILEKVHRRVQRTVYVDGEVIELIEEPNSGPSEPKDASVVYVDEDFQIPEPSETTTVQEFTDEEGRRVVVKTTTRTTYEETVDDDGSPVILEKVQKKVQRTVYVDGEIVEETFDAPDGGEENIELPPSTEREEVEEQTDELGRKVVIRSVYTTTYEQDSDADGNIVILEKVQKRVFRTVFVDGKEIVEEVPEPTRKQSVEYNS